MLPNVGAQRGFYCESRSAPYVQNGSYPSGPRACPTSHRTSPYIDGVHLSLTESSTKVRHSTGPCPAVTAPVDESVASQNQQFSPLRMRILSRMTADRQWPTRISATTAFRARPRQLFLDGDGVCTYIPLLPYSAIDSIRM